jgi:hypothetical protein
MTGEDDATMLARTARLLRALPIPAAATFLFCLFMVCVYMPYDVLVKPLVSDISRAQEVWLGYRLEGWYAKVTEPIHWAIYAALAHGMYHERPWAWPCASIYTAQVAVASLVWVCLYADYGPLGWVGTALAISGFVWLAIDLWRRGPRTPLVGPAGAPEPAASLPASRP